jgi:hypothetical protein
MTDEQGVTLARLAAGQPSGPIRVLREPYGLPEGFVLVIFPNGRGMDGFTCGIAPDGRASS